MLVAFLTSSNVGIELLRVSKAVVTVSGIVIFSSWEADGISIGGIFIVPNPRALLTPPTSPLTALRTAFCAEAASDIMFFSIVERVELRKVTVSSAESITLPKLALTASVKRQRYVSRN